MKKYDCSKPAHFIHEYNRLCESYDDGCYGCPLSKKGLCPKTAGINQEAVDIVQKWSDEYTGKTRQDMILELFPNATILEDGIVAINACSIDKTKCVQDCMYKRCSDCRKEFWNAPYEEG